ncbi:hypothetical protein BA195_05830 [Tenacibaculum soleae]|uniref:Uncharacterized protein n=1 Tax=Tenacibaculum soleae TaxID=447689 RepID=A0A1B9Y340_9FLAO|nr:hypothetical protein [Tenacibaculum soleae]OCK44202.1 hypothetical protein BA195_05830 [Tenacibaculum soleae]
MNLKELLHYNITSFLEKGLIDNELDFQRGKIASRKLRLLSKENEKVNKTRKALNKLLYNYEQKHWADFESVTDEQIKESEIAKQTASKEIIIF